MKKTKSNIITDYDTFNNELKAELKVFHPNGFGEAIVEFTNKEKKRIAAIRWETSDKIYLLRLSNKMLVQILQEEDELDNYY